MKVLQHEPGLQSVSSVMVRFHCVGLNRILLFLSDLTNYICVKTWNMTPPLWLFEEHLGDSLQITVSKNVERNARILKTYLETGQICWQNFNSADICIEKNICTARSVFYSEILMNETTIKKSCLNWNKTWQRYFHGDLAVYGAWRCLCWSRYPFHCKNNKNSYVELKNEKTFLKVEKLWHLLVWNVGHNNSRASVQLPIYIQNLKFC